VPILLLTAKGRKSGEPRTIPIIYTAYRNSFVIIASKGGSPVHPKWYLNILEDPNVTVQIKAETFKAMARTASSPEREVIWAEAVKSGRISTSINRAPLVRSQWSSSSATNG